MAESPVPDSPVPDSSVPDSSVPDDRADLGQDPTNDPRALTARKNLDALLDVELPLIAVLAEKQLSLAEILELEVDSVIVFPKHNSDPISLRVNNVEVGSGKTIKVGDHFGLHLRHYSPEKVVHTLL
jgi:flagellar motor switch protein FliN/FliY